jgi:hypothetical protein
MIAWLLLNRKLAAGIGLTLAVLAFCGWLYWKGGSDKEDRIELNAVKAAVTVREKQNEIRDHRPDTEQLVDRLLRGTF